MKGWTFVTEAIVRVVLLVPAAGAYPPVQGGLDSAAPRQVALDAHLDSLGGGSHERLWRSFAHVL